LQAQRGGRAVLAAVMHAAAWLCVLLPQGR
jgi:hypothetical protein